MGVIFLENNNEEEDDDDTPYLAREGEVKGALFGFRISSVCHIMCNVVL